MVIPITIHGRVKYWRVHKTFLAYYLNWPTSIDLSNFNSSFPTAIIFSNLIENLSTSTVTIQLRPKLSNFILANSNFPTTRSYQRFVLSNYLTQSIGVFFLNFVRRIPVFTSESAISAYRSSFKTGAPLGLKNFIISWYHFSKKHSWAM